MSKAEWFYEKIDRENGYKRQSAEIKRQEETKQRFESLFHTETRVEAATCCRAN